MWKNIVLLGTILLFLGVFDISVQAQDCKSMKYENSNNVNPPPLIMRIVNGIVQDHDGVPIPKACVGIFKNKRLIQYFQTNEEGRFRFSHISSGNYQMVVKYDPFCPANIRVKVVIRNKQYTKGKIVVHMEASQIDSCSRISYGWYNFTDTGGGDPNGYTTGYKPGSRLSCMIDTAIEPSTRR